MRVGAVAVKEFWGLVRQPRLLLLLLVGPVLIMAAFGLSLNVQSIVLPRALVVVKYGSAGAELFERFRGEFANRTSSLETTGDFEAAERRLSRGEVDAVIAVPPEPLEQIEQGEQAVVDVTYNTINPIFGSIVPERSYSLIYALNLDIIRTAIETNIGDLRSAQERINELNSLFDEGTDEAAQTLASEEAQDTTGELDAALGTLANSLRLLQAVSPEEEEDISEALEQVEAARQAVEEVQEAQAAGPQEIQDTTGVSDLEESLDSLQETLAGLPTGVSPEVLASPLTLDLTNLANPPGIVGFYAPGVLGLLIQHIALSLASLAVIRERLGGTYEFFEVSPLGPGELLAGKFITYFAVVLGMMLAVAAILAVALGIPIAGGVAGMVLAIVLLIFASLGLGFLISALARSQLQAVQVSMLLLIASVLFSGFLLPLGDMGQPAGAISYLLPATYGILGLQDVMIRGEFISFFDLAGLLVFAGICLALARYFMGRKTT